MKIYHIPIFVPHKGCPHDCVFCNQRQITGQAEDTKPEEVKNIIENHLTTMTGDYYAEVAFFGGSFTGIDIKLQKDLMEAAYPYVKSGKIHGIRCSTRPDYITTDILDNFQKYGGRCIELGVQSTDPDVLQNSRRGHSFNDVLKASEMIKKRGIDLGVQMMLGLPGDTREKMIKTASDLISLNPKCVRIYPTLVVADTALSVMCQNGKYNPMTVEEAVDVLAIVIPMFKKAGVDVIRVGLQTTDDINESTVKGPYHAAIKELAEGRIVRNVIGEHIKDKNAPLEVICHPSRVSVTVGHKGCNKAYFKENHNLSLLVKTSKDIGPDELKIYDKIIAFY